MKQSKFKSKSKILLLLFLTLILRLITAPVARAVCPVCTVAVAAGLGLSRWLGVDDTVSGIWIGGLILSSSLWLTSWLSKKCPKLHSTFYLLLSTFLMYLLTLLPLTWTDVIGHPFNRIWGVDKLIAGTAFGSAAFWIGTWLDKKVRTLRGRQLFKYQKIVFPVALLVLLSVIAWLITKP